MQKKQKDPSSPPVLPSLVFGVGPRELEEFRMIERHYFRDQLVKSYDFTFGYAVL
jgi:hypothetical protein